MKKFYFCSLTEINGEYEYPSKFLINCKENEIDDLIEQIAKTYRSEEPGTAEYEESNCFLNDDGCTATKIDNYTEIPKDHYNIMKQYLATLS